MSLLVTGPRGSGKTTFCKELLRSVTTLSAPGEPVGALAFLSKRLIGALPQEEGYDLEMLNIRRIEAEAGFRDSEHSDRRIVPLVRSKMAAPPWDGPLLGPWVFSPDAFGAAEALFYRELPRLKHGDLFLLDEIGPLELRLNQGFAPLLDQLPLLPRTVIVVRPGLLEVVKRVLTQGPKEGTDEPAVVSIEAGAFRDEGSYRAMLEESANSLMRSASL